MKVPVSTTQSSTVATGKPLPFNNTALNTTYNCPTSNPSSNTSTVCYEPTSVLDLQRSPSPATKPSQPPPSDIENNNPKSHPSAADLDNSEAWDSILSELGLSDDPSNPNHSKLLLSQFSPSVDSNLSHVLPDFTSSQTFDHTPPPINLPSDYPSFCDFNYTHGLSTPNFGNFDLNPPQTNINTVGLDFIDDLIRGAQAYESNDSHQLQVILARLNQRLRSPHGKPLQRAAFYFKEALQQLANSGNNSPAHNPTRPPKMSSYEVVQTIRATKSFSGISPVSLFSTFAANQAILEAVDGASFIHIIDFDIGFGGHWASFMRELVDKAIDPMKLSSIILRITAVVPEEFGIESKLVRENLTQFARELNLNFHIDYVLIPTFEILSFKSVKFIDGEKVAVHLSPAVFHKFTNNSRSGISKFVADLRGISPSSVVVMDREVGIDVGTASFGVSFVAGIEFYTGMLESLDVAAAGGGFVGGGDCVRRIETFVLRPRIVAVVEAAARATSRRSTTWREVFTAAGMRVVGFSQFADFQAECLLKRAQVGGFHVAKRHGEMMLFWHDRPLVATSAWRS